MEPAGFIVQSVLFGVALAMDAFAVSVVNGLAEPDMRKARMAQIAGCFSFFQIIMPLIGWLLVRTAESLLAWLEGLIPWIALILLVLLGGRMILDGLRGDAEDAKAIGSIPELLAAGVATSIDALSVGFAISGLSPAKALIEALIRGAGTSVICIYGIKAGKGLSSSITKKAPLLGGAILIAIGLKIFFG